MLILCVYSLITLGFMNDGKGWSLRQNSKVAPVPSREGVSFHIPFSKGLCQSLSALFFMYK